MSLPPIAMWPTSMSSRPGEHPQRGALTRTRRPDEHDELAVGDVEVQRIHRELVRTLVDARGVLVGDCGHGCLPLFSKSHLMAPILNNSEISQKLIGELVPIIYKALQATA
jgi:hypothetical protein